MPSKAEIRPISPYPGWEGFSINLDLGIPDLATVADAVSTLSNIKDVINKSKVGKAEISVIDESVYSVVECIRNDRKISEKVFSRRVFIALIEGHENIALDIIRKVVPNAAQQINVELSTEDQERVAQIILGRARKIQQKANGKELLK